MKELDVEHMARLIHFLVTKVSPTSLQEVREWLESEAEK
jgi:hypothetical protein